MASDDEQDHLLVHHNRNDILPGPSSRTSSRAPSRLGSKRPSFELEEVRRRRSEDIERIGGSGRSSRNTQRSEHLERICKLSRLFRIF
jgi:hypothetical protein